MKQAIYTRYGPPEVLHIIEVDKPQPKVNEILIKVCATSVSSGDVRLRKADPFLARLMFGLFRPNKNVLGFDISGEIEATGSEVTKFKSGDFIFGCVGFKKTGYTEYLCLPENAVIAKKPENLSCEEAAPVFFGAQTALYYLSKANVDAGHKVLIYGASGCVGTYAVQLARYFGAEVSAVCSTKNIDLVKSLGASKVYDYTKEDFSDAGETYDAIFDTVGKSPFFTCVKAIKKDGYFLRAVHMSLKSILSGLWTSMTTKIKIIGGTAPEKLEDLLFLKDLLEKGEIRPVIDKTYSLDQISEAHAYVEQGHKVGNVVIKIP